VVGFLGSSASSKTSEGHVTISLEDVGVVPLAEKAAEYRSAQVDDGQQENEAPEVHQHKGHCYDFRRSAEVNSIFHH